MQYRGGAGPRELYSARRMIAFRRVNRPGSAGYDPGMQRHHLLPLQLLSRRCFCSMFDAIGYRQGVFHDFRNNGLLLPANEDTAVRDGMPLHRGPHPEYNAMVIARVGRIEEAWSRESPKDPAVALDEALYRLALLQAALRKRLLYERHRLVLNNKDPLGTGFDFTELDAMAEQLWNAN